MQLTEIVKEIENRNNSGELSSERVTCAHCGNTWVELIGLIVGQKEGSEDLYLRIGIESDFCQTCRHRPLECRECGSKDVYKIMPAKGVSNDVPLSFKGIKKVSRNADAETL